MTTSTLQIDFFADPSCPWCYVGFHALQAARRCLGVPSALHWRPFLLRPDAPDAGVDRQEFYSQIRAADPQRFEASRAALAAAVEALGLAPLQTNSPARLPNAINTHRLLLWAAPRGLQEQMAEALLDAYWRDGADLGDPEVLIGHGVAAGMDRAILTDLFSGDADRMRVLELYAMAVRAGVTGVPVVVKNGASGVMGAHSAEQYATFLAAA